MRVISRTPSTCLALTTPSRQDHPGMDASVSEAFETMHRPCCLYIRPRKQALLRQLSPRAALTTRSCHLPESRLSPPLPELAVVERQGEFDRLRLSSRWPITPTRSSVQRCRRLTHYGAREPPYLDVRHGRMPFLPPCRRRPRLINTKNTALRALNPRRPSQSQDGRHGFNVFKAQADDSLGGSLRAFFLLERNHLPVRRNPRRASPSTAGLRCHTS